MAKGDSDQPWNYLTHATEQKYVATTKLSLVKFGYETIKVFCQFQPEKMMH